MQIILENIRSFAGRHCATIKPLTILTGENSSGKSTFMGIVSLLYSPQEFPFQTNFNKPPFELGNYDTIATYRGGKFGRAQSFSIGQRTKVGEVIATYSNKSGQPALIRFESKDRDDSIEMEFVHKDNKTKVKGTIHLKLENDESLPLNIDEEVQNFNRLSLIEVVLNFNPSEKPDKKPPPYFSSLLRLITRLSPSSALSIAPIRTKPKRTYDQATETYNPEGDHMPFVLDRIFNEATPKSEKTALQAALNEFGKESGLFQKIDVKNLGKKLGEPFQIMISTTGPSANLLDVGYGVSQALPVVVQSLLAEKESLLLLQQPEVHLHPRAQAALGSFFVGLVQSSKKQCMIETHSDYIIDRIRQEVASRNISHNDVAILFFEKEKTGSTIHELSLDENGNILNAPDSYREFFLEEELNLLSRTSR